MINLKLYPDKERGSGTRNKDPEQEMKHPMTLYKWCNDLWGAWTRHVCTWGTSDPLFRYFNRLIKANVFGNGAFGDRKSRDTLISQ